MIATSLVTMMRTLDFGQELSLSSDGKLAISNRPRLCARIIAYLAWPECAERRDQYLATVGARHLHHVFERLDEVAQYAPHGDHDSTRVADSLCQDPQHRIALIKIRVLLENFAAFGGGFKALAAAAFKEALQKLWESGLGLAALAGERLLLTARMALHHAKDLRGGASLSKATDLIARSRSQYQEPKSKKSIMEAWTSHQNVAHLAAAGHAIRGAILSSKRSANGTQVPKVTILDNILKHTELFIQLSQDFLHFGLTFKASRCRQTILEGERVWRLPGNLATRPLNGLLPPLSKAQHEYLHTQRWAPAPPD